MNATVVSSVPVFSPDRLPPPGAFAEGVIIPVDKPLGWTSADVVRKVKFVVQRYAGLRKLKVGHAGTLDPLATGVLLVCTGKATRLAEGLQAAEKEYVAEMRLGATTPSFDMETAVDARYPCAHVTRAMAEAALRGLVGRQEQLPPAFSAKMVDGRRAYEWARAGREVAMRTATVTVYDAELLAFRLPVVTARIVCGRGTYIRALARDFGQALQSGAFLTALLRTRSGHFNDKESITIENFLTFFTGI